MIFLYLVEMSEKPYFHYNRSIEFSQHSKRNYMKKVIVIGLDGFAPKVVEPMLAAGELPNLAKLRRQGGYSRLRTTYPPQTPVAWSTFSTGTNPGGHGIFDFFETRSRDIFASIGAESI